VGGATDRAGQQTKQRKCEQKPLKAAQNSLFFISFNTFHSCTFSFRVRDTRKYKASSKGITNGVLGYYHFTVFRALRQFKTVI
jgi:hypothetical protein